MHQHSCEVGINIIISASRCRSRNSTELKFRYTRLSKLYDYVWQKLQNNCRVLNTLRGTGPQDTFELIKLNWAVQFISVSLISPLSRLASGLIAMGSLCSKGVSPRVYPWHARCWFNISSVTCHDFHSGNTQHARLYRALWWRVLTVSSRLISGNVCYFLDDKHIAVAWK